VKHCRYGNTFCAGMLTLGALGCGSTDSDNGAASSDTVAHIEQAVIPGAVVTETSTIVNLPPETTLAEQQVNCPSGSVVVGGGYRSASWTRVYSSGPNLNGWSVSIQNPSTTSTTLTLVAECLSGTVATSGLVAPGSAIIPKNGYECTRAVCPSGSILTAGGYTAPSSFRASSSSLVSDGGAWQVCGWNENPADYIFMFAYPLCLRGVSGTTSRVYKSGPRLAPGSSMRVYGDACPSGFLLGGGGHSVRARSVYTQGTLSAQNPRRWSNLFVNLSNVEETTSVITTCLNLWQ
jgi:hypothetical protein